jgi:putative membrane protein
MIVRNDLSLKRIWPQAYRRLLVLLIFDCAVAGLYSLTHSKWLTLDGMPLAPLGSALTIFLVFRTNAAYGRWSVPHPHRKPQSIRR